MIMESEKYFKATIILLVSVIRAERNIFSFGCAFILKIKLGACQLLPKSVVLIERIESCVGLI